MPSVGPVNICLDMAFSLIVGRLSRRVHIPCICPLTGGVVENDYFLSLFIPR